MGRILATLIIGGTLLAAATPASATASGRTGLAPGQTLAAASPSAGWVTFGTGTWKNNVGNPGSGLVTTSKGTVTNETYGGASLSGTALPTNDPTALPADGSAFSYDFNPAQSGASGGSPRMVVCFSDSDPAGSCNSNADLGPNTWTANSWLTINGSGPLDGSNNVWVNNGGTCGYVYNTDWGTIVGCHPNSLITEILVVNDSGWITSPAPEKVTLDNINFDGAVATGP